MDTWTCEQCRHVDTWICGHVDKSNTREIQRRQLQSNRSTFKVETQQQTFRNSQTRHYQATRWTKSWSMRHRQVSVPVSENIHSTITILLLTAYSIINVAVSTVVCQAFQFICLTHVVVRMKFKRFMSFSTALWQGLLHVAFALLWCWSSHGEQGTMSKRVTAYDMSTYKKAVGKQGQLTSAFVT